ncbi:MAG: hypothetical protein CBE14_000480 [Rickettsiales bacterium TMED254]|nr:MAG: hypothetical protein CBC04_00160 [Verrucomicrobia bacterium TMED44]RPF77825.1 MAG: hypothetical protein CBE14_000480 [Rickettsiales bacterium TMED254]|tara:strand:+ start:308 stop:505 length:198 start_codon:yes stop_codon:yes gene_type:complete
MSSDGWNKNAMEYGEGLSPQEEIKDLKNEVKKLKKKVKKLEADNQPDISKELEFWDKHNGKLLTE